MGRIQRDRADFAETGHRTGLGAVFALVFGYRARRQIRAAAGSQTGSGLATAGIILGWIGIALVVTVVILIALHPSKSR